MDRMAVYLGRSVVWNSCRGNHRGQRSCASAPQAGHMDASDLIKTLQKTLRGGGRPHMGPVHVVAPARRACRQLTARPQRDTTLRRHHADAAVPSINSRTIFNSVADEYGFMTIGSRACSRSASKSATPVT
jgi:hypothetical protein